MILCPLVMRPYREGSGTRMPKKSSPMTLVTRALVSILVLASFVNVRHRRHEVAQRCVRMDAVIEGAKRRVAMRVVSFLPLFVRPMSAEKP